MKCDTCKEECAVIMRVVVAKGYNRSLTRPMFNCPACFEKKERSRGARGAGAESLAPAPLNHAREDGMR